MTHRSPRIRRIVVALAAAAFAGGAAFAAVRAGDRPSGPAHHGDRGGPAAPPAGSRPAPIVHRPPGLSRARPVPLVIALHPTGGTPAGFEASSGLDTVADRHGFVVAYLGSTTRTPAWLRVDIAANLAYISAEIRRISASQNIDPGRVYVTGFSAGATMTFFVGCELSRQVDGVAAVSGAMLRSGEPCAVRRPVSALLVIGTNEHIPIGGSAALLSVAEVAAGWRARNGCSDASTSARTGPVRQQTWTDCNERSAVGVYLVQNGIHEWPGAPGTGGPDARYDAAAGIWAFFASHPGGGPANQVAATLTSVRARAGAAGPSVAVALSLQEPVKLSASVARRGFATVRRDATLARTDGAALVLPVPRAAAGTRVTVTLQLADRYGRRATIVRRVAVPG